MRGEFQCELQFGELADSFRFSADTTCWVSDDISGFFAWSMAPLKVGLERYYRVAIQRNQTVFQSPKFDCPITELVWLHIPRVSMDSSSEDPRQVGRHDSDDGSEHSTDLLPSSKLSGPLHSDHSPSPTLDCAVESVICASFENGEISILSDRCEILVKQRMMRQSINFMRLSKPTLSLLLFCDSHLAVIPHFELEEVISDALSQLRLAYNRDEWPDKPPPTASRVAGLQPVRTRHTSSSVVRSRGRMARNNRRKRRTQSTPQPSGHLSGKPRVAMVSQRHGLFIPRTPLLRPLKVTLKPFWPSLVTDCVCLRWPLSLMKADIRDDSVSHWINGSQVSTKRSMSSLSSRRGTGGTLNRRSAYGKGRRMSLKTEDVICEHIVLFGADPCMVYAQIHSSKEELSVSELAKTVTSKVVTSAMSMLSKGFSSIFSVTSEDTSEGVPGSPQKSAENPISWELQRSGDVEKILGSKCKRYAIQTRWDDLTEAMFVSGSSDGASDFSMESSEPRCLENAKLSSDESMIICNDHFGRVLLFETQTMSVLRLFKGQRSAQCCFYSLPSLIERGLLSTMVHSDDERSSLGRVNLIIIYLSSRGVLQVFHPYQKRRLCAFNTVQNGRLLHSFDCSFVSNLVLSGHEDRLLPAHPDRNSQNHTHRVFLWFPMREDHLKRRIEESVDSVIADEYNFEDEESGSMQADKSVGVASVQMLENNESYSVSAEQFDLESSHEMSMEEQSGHTRASSISSPDRKRSLPGITHPLSGPVLYEIRVIHSGEIDTQRQSLMEGRSSKTAAELAAWLQKYTWKIHRDTIIEEFLESPNDYWPAILEFQPRILIRNEKSSEKVWLVDPDFMEEKMFCVPLMSDAIQACLDLNEDAAEDDSTDLFSEQTVPTHGEGEESYPTGDETISKEKRPCNKEILKWRQRLRFVRSYWKIVSQLLSVLDQSRKGHFSLMDKSRLMILESSKMDSDKSADVSSVHSDEQNAEQNEEKMDKIEEEKAPEPFLVSLSLWCRFWDGICRNHGYHREGTHPRRRHRKLPVKPSQLRDICRFLFGNTFDLESGNPLIIGEVLTEIELPKSLESISVELFLKWFSSVKLTESMIGLSLVSQLSRSEDDRISKWIYRSHIRRLDSMNSDDTTVDRDGSQSPSSSNLSGLDFSDEIFDDALSHPLSEFESRMLPVFEVFHRIDGAVNPLRHFVNHSLMLDHSLLICRLMDALLNTQSVEMAVSSEWLVYASRILKCQIYHFLFDSKLSNIAVQISPVLGLSVIPSSLSISHSRLREFGVFPRNTCLLNEKHSAYHFTIDKIDDGRVSISRLFADYILSMCEVHSGNMDVQSLMYVFQTIEQCRRDMFDDFREYLDGRAKGTGTVTMDKYQEWKTQIESELSEESSKKKEETTEEEREQKVLDIVLKVYQLSRLFDFRCLIPECMLAFCLARICSKMIDDFIHDSDLTHFEGISEWIRVSSYILDHWTTTQECSLKLVKLVLFQCNAYVWYHLLSPMINEVILCCVAPSPSEDASESTLSARLRSLSLGKEPMKKHRRQQEELTSLVVDWLKLMTLRIIPVFAEGDLNLDSLWKSVVNLAFLTPAMVEDESEQQFEQEEQDDPPAIKRRQTVRGASSSDSLISELERWPSLEICSLHLKQTLSSVSRRLSFKQNAHSALSSPVMVRDEYFSGHDDAGVSLFRWTTTLQMYLACFRLVFTCLRLDLPYLGEADNGSSTVVPKSPPLSKKKSNTPDEKSNEIDVFVVYDSVLCEEEEMVGGLRRVGVAGDLFECTKPESVSVAAMTSEVTERQKQAVMRVAKKHISMALDLSADLGLDAMDIRLAMVAELCVPKVKKPSLKKDQMAVQILDQPSFRDAMGVSETLLVSDTVLGVCENRLSALLRLRVMKEPRLQSEIVTRIPPNLFHSLLHGPDVPALSTVVRSRSSKGRSKVSFLLDGSLVLTLFVLDLLESVSVQSESDTTSVTQRSQLCRDLVAVVKLLKQYF